VKNIPIIILLTAICLSAIGQDIPSSQRSKEAVKRVMPDLKKEFEQKDLTLGNEVFIRIFKKTDKLEVWIKKDNQYQLFKTYEICDFSGGLGPKKKSGDNKSPEGFYFVKPNQLNPWSNFHLSFNIGYPNAYDRAHDYTGSYLMVHGNCVSIGCYAMGNKNIEEIWTIITQAFEDGQPFFRIHIFPFRMTEENMLDNQHNKNIEFWKNLKEGYDHFEEHKLPPNVLVSNKQYVFEKLE
jgi:murein L,D-transpeptidase YafK